MNSATKILNNSNGQTSESIIVGENIQKTDGSLQTKKYKLGKLIARGVMSTVYEAEDEISTKKMAIKIVNKSLVEEKDAKKNLINAIALQKSLKHHHIVYLDQTFEDTKNIYVIMEFCTNQTLRDLVIRKGKLTEQEASHYLQQLLKALKYIHSHNIIHRDIILEHLFLNEKMELMIGGFGRARKLRSSNDRRVTIIGPNDSQISEMSYQTDIRAVGSVMYHLIVGEPFSTPDNFYKYQFCTDTKVVFSCNVPISVNAKDLIITLLDPKTCKKVTLDKILQHPFFTDPKNSFNTQSFSLSTDSGTCVQPSAKINLDLSSIPYIQTANTSLRGYSNFNSNNGKSISSDTFLSSPRNILSKVHDSVISSQTTAKTIPHSDLSLKKSHSWQRGTTEQNISKDLTIGSQNQSHTLTQEEGICVTKWLDYSSKYGFGYILSDGSTGVMFQDGSTIISKSNLTFEYLEAKSAQGNEHLRTYYFEGYPEPLQKKVKLYKLFQEHLDNNDSNVCCIEYALKNTQHNKVYHKEKENSINFANKCLYYVKKWIKTDRALFFKFNMKLVQIVFKDGTVFALSPLDKHIIYICEKGKRYCYKEEREKLLKNTEVQEKILYVQKKLKSIWKDTKADTS